MLRLLIMYIMGIYDEISRETTIDNDSLAKTLVNCYSDDFKYIKSEKSDIDIDILENWEKFCGIWTIIETIEYFHSDKLLSYLINLKEHMK